MRQPHFRFLVAVHALFMLDGKLLLLERQNTGYADGFLGVPAGHVDGGETIIEALKREVAEEVGIKLSANLLPAHVLHRIISSDEERIDYFFVIHDWSGKLCNTEPNKCARLVWADVNNLPKTIIPYIRFAFDQVQSKQLFSEFSDPLPT